MLHIWYEKKTFEKNKDYSLSKFECFEHVKTFSIYVKFWALSFAINEKKFKKIMTIQIIMLRLGSFKHLKMQF